MHARIIIFFFLFSLAINAQQKDSTVVKQPATTTTLAELREQLDDYFNDPSFVEAFSGVYIKSLRTGEVLYKRNADKLFVPASNVKLFTTAAALQTLGPDFAYETNIYAVGELKKGTLKGDLVIQGSGDPTISNRFYGGNVTQIFEKWADTLKALGIWEITGNLYGDDSYFDGIGFSKSWLTEYDHKWFAAPTGALSFNDNSLKIEITPTDVNLPAKIELTPNTSYINLVPKVITTDDDTPQEISVSVVKGTHILSINGHINKSAVPFVENVAVSDPSTYFLTVLKETLEKKGIIIRGRVGSLESADRTFSSDEFTPIYTNISVPLKLILKETNKNSNNFYAEQLLKTLGAEEFGEGSVENGVKVCKQFFNEMGISSENMVMIDGSGLSYLNLFTPKQIVNLLVYMSKSDNYLRYLESLPIGGVDGTLIDRMKKSSAENNVRAKPGYSNYTSTLSGYLKTLGGEPIVFSIMLNHFLVSPKLATYIQDNVCHRLINFVRN